MHSCVLWLLGSFQPTPFCTMYSREYAQHESVIPTDPCIAPTSVTITQISWTTVIPTSSVQSQDLLSLGGSNDYPILHGKKQGSDGKRAIKEKQGKGLGWKLYPNNDIPLRKIHKTRSNKPASLLV